MNSDVIYHMCDKSGKMKLIHVDSAYMGKLLVTKKTDCCEYEDITSTYKYPEGTFHSIQVYRIKRQYGI